MRVVAVAVDGQPLAVQDAAAIGVYAQPDRPRVRELVPRLGYRGVGRRERLVGLSGERRGDAGGGFGGTPADFQRRAEKVGRPTALQIEAGATAIQALIASFRSDAAVSTAVVAMWLLSSGTSSSP